MDSTIIFLSIFFIVLSVMLVIKIKIYLDLFGNKCIVNIYLFEIRIVKIDIDLIGLSFKINNNKKNKTLNIILSKEEKYLIKQIKSTVLDKLYYDDISLSLDIGVADPSVSALSCGVVDFIVFNIINKFYISNKDIDVLYEKTCLFNELGLIVNLDIKVYFTLFDLLFAFIISFYKRGKYAKQRK